MATLLHWDGRSAEALPLARRAWMLEERFAENLDYDCCLLTARILLRLGQRDDARRTWARVAEGGPPDRSEGAGRYIDYHMVRLALGEPQRVLEGGCAGAVSWDDLLTLAEESGAWEQEVLELLYWRARAALEQRRLQEVAAALDLALRKESRMWRSDFEQLGAKLTSCRMQPAAGDG